MGWGSWETLEITHPSAPEQISAHSSKVESGVQVWSSVIFSHFHHLSRLSFHHILVTWKGFKERIFPCRLCRERACSQQIFDGIPVFSAQVESDYCLLLALPCGRDQEDVVNQTESLKAAFISYLQAKQAAGIINVPNPGSNQVWEKPQTPSVN